MLLGWLNTQPGIPKCQYLTKIIFLTNWTFKHYCPRDNADYMLDQSCTTVT